MTDQDALERFKGDLKFMKETVSPDNVTNQILMYEKAIEALEYKLDNSENLLSNKDNKMPSETSSPEPEVGG